MMIYLIILVCVLCNGIWLIAMHKRRKNWETVEGVITFKTERPANDDTFGYITYEFLHDGILYENKEKFVSEDAPFNDSKVTVFINPKNIYKSTVRLENLVKLTPII